MATGLLLLTVTVVVLWSISSPLSTTAQIQDGETIGAELGPRETRRGQFIYHAAILSDEEYFCSGALVSTRWLLTTGQCTAGKESFVVYLGGQNLEVPETKRVTVVTRRSIIHPQFELLGLKHDVALIDLHSPVSISAWVGVVTLPMKDLEDVTYTDENVLLTAWGSRHVRLQDKVQYFFNTSLMSAEECSRVYDDRIQSNHICAVMAWNTDSCFSESGSPIVTQEEDASTLIGLLSFNDHCSEDPFHPGVASKAAPSSDLDIVALEPVTRYMPVLEGAPKYPGSRIVNGNQASRGQFPHQAALYLDGRSFCGGSLISTSWILTAAHCTLNIGTVTAHLGAQSLNSVESGRVTLATRNLINHASYNPSNLNNDISLVRLPSAVVLNAFIQLVHLPRHSQASTTYAGVASQVSGWGRNSDSATGVSNNLNFVNLNIITNAVCAQTYGTAVIIGSTICASGAGGRSTCNGDSGGPLVLNQASGYLQIGVVSFVSGAGCASGNPSGYVRTGHFLSWISANTGIHIAN